MSDKLQFVVIVVSTQADCKKKKVDKLKFVGRFDNYGRR